VDTHAESEVAEGVGTPADDGGPTGPEPAAQDVPEGAQAKVAELTADLQRLQAEYLNYKRRVDRDRDLVLQNAKFSVLSALLPVLDDVDRAREHGELVGGFKAVADSLERIVAGEGLVRFGEQGDEFDPRVHEALMHSLSPHVTTTTCDKVVQGGYRIGDRVVRPALVTVVDPDPHATSDVTGTAVASAPVDQAGPTAGQAADQTGAQTAEQATGQAAGQAVPGVDEWLDTEGRPHLTSGGETPAAGSH
jgi:molecular chaperone GrpE